MYNEFPEYKNYIFKSTVFYIYILSHSAGDQGRGALVIILRTKI